MSFQNPLWLLGLLIVPALAGIYLLMQGRRRAYAVRFTNLELLRSVVPHPPRFRRHLPPIFFLLGIAGLLLAAAGPILNLEVARNQASRRWVAAPFGKARQCSPRAATTSRLA